MITYNLYLHGVPIGHDVWGPEEDINYLNRFYKDNVEIQENSILQIEIYHGKTFYTYLRKNSVQNAEKRPGSYFGITLSFEGKFCNNVFILFKIFDAVYKQICVGSLISQEGKTERFLVRKFADANAVIGKINAAFNQQLEKLLSNSFSNLDTSFKQVGTTKFNLSDVDSPSFLETFKAQVVLVSPEYNSKQDELSSALRQIQPLKQQIEDLNHTVDGLEKKNQSLGESNEGFKSRVLSLEKEIGRLNNLLDEADQNASAKYKSQIEEVKAELAQLKKDYKKSVTEKEKYAEEIKELKRAIEAGEADKELYDFFKIIKEPLNTFVRQSANRFQGSSSSNGTESGANGTAFSIKAWKPWINTFLLCCILALSIYSITTSSSSGNNDIRITKEVFEDLKGKYQSLRDSVDAVNNQQIETHETEVESTTNVDEDLPEYTINIQGYSGSGSLSVGKVYKLNVKDYTGMCIWSAEGNATLNGNNLTITGVGSVTISGRATGIKVKSRTVSTANNNANSTQKKDSVK